MSNFTFNSIQRIQLSTNINEQVPGLLYIQIKTTFGAFRRAKTQRIVTVGNVTFKLELGRQEHSKPSNDITFSRDDQISFPDEFTTELSGHIKNLCDKVSTSGETSSSADVAKGKKNKTWLIEKPFASCARTLKTSKCRRDKGCYGTCIIEISLLLLLSLLLLQELIQVNLILSVHYRPTF